MGMAPEALLLYWYTARGRRRAAWQQVWKQVWKQAWQQAARLTLSRHAHAALHVA
jgi:hypothetical protein